MLYRAMYWLVLQRLPAEATHRVSFALLRAATAVPPIRWCLARLTAHGRADQAVRVFDFEVPGRLGLAAGFDKDAKGVDALLALGFGFVEVGTVTAQPQPGNPMPRMFRLPADRALINRLGFNNRGAAVAAAQLRKPRRGIVGVNIGKTKAVAEADAIADYVSSTEQLAPLADYLVVNVSSPNTPGLRDLQAVHKLEPLLQAVRLACDRVSPMRRVPLLVKIAPDLADADIDDVAAMVERLGLDGVVATNTTIARDGLRTPAAKVALFGAGGLSGAPLTARSLEVLRQLRRQLSPSRVIISVGGISTVADAQARLDAGATLLQAYTGFIYGGPLWAKHIQRGLRVPATAVRLDATG